MRTGENRMTRVEAKEVVIRIKVNMLVSRKGKARKTREKGIVR